LRCARLFFIALRARRWRADGARTESDAAGDGQVERGLQLQRGQQEIETAGRGN